MKSTRQNTTIIAAKTSFNYNKLQAVACIVASAAVSVGLIYWAIRAFF